MRRERKLGPRRPVTEPGSPGGSGARAAGCAAEPQCGPGAPPGRTPAAFVPHGPRPEAASATHPAGRSPGPLAVVIAARAGRQAQPRCCGRIPATRRPGRGAPGGGEGDGAGPVSGCPPAPRGHGRTRQPALRSARPWRWPGETPAHKVGAARASEHRRSRLRELRHLHPLGLGNSPPSLGHSSRPRT